MRVLDYVLLLASSVPQINYAHSCLDVEDCDLCGLYVQSGSRANELSNQLPQSINMVVIDLKDDNGNITYRENLNTNDVNLKDLVKALKSKGIYTVARIVVFKDNKKAKEDPSMAIRNKDGTICYDKTGTAWLNPYNERVFDYVINISRLAVSLGFDEIQYDYIRFCSEKNFNISGLTKHDAKYGKNRIEIINEFISKAYNIIHNMGCKLSVDVFGCTIPHIYSTWEQDIKVLGQDYETIAKTVDYICPMIYPSHWCPVSRFKYPDLYPYDIVKYVMEVSNEYVEPEKVRAWIQGFTLKRGKYQIYTLKEVQAQINALRELGYKSFCIWYGKAHHDILKECL